MSLAKKAISGTIWMAGISYLGFLINFAGQIILARILGPEDFGVFALALSIAQILFMFFGFSFSMACIQLQSEKDVFDTAMIMSLLAGLAIILLGGAVSITASFIFPGNVCLFIFILCCAEALGFPALIYSAYQEKEFLFRRNTLIRMTSRSLSLLISIILALMGFGVWSLIGREILTAGSLLLGMRVSSDYTFSWKFNKDTAKKIWRFSYKMLFLRFTTVGFNRLPNLFVGSFAGTRFLGLFERSLYLATIPNAMLAPFHQQAAFPIYSRVQDHNEKIAEGLYWILSLLIWLILPIGLVVFLFPEVIITTVLGERWLMAAPLFHWFAIYLVFIVIFQCLQQVFLAKGEVNTATKAWIISLILVMLGIFIAIFNSKYWQYVPLAMGFGLMLGSFYMFKEIFKLRIRLPVKDTFFYPILSIIAFLGITKIFKNNFNSEWFFIIVIFLLWFFVCITLEHKNFLRLYKRLRAM